MAVIKGIRVTLRREPIKDYVKKVNKNGLASACALIRKIAQNSMRRKPGASVAPNPPHVHNNDPYSTLRNIDFKANAEAGFAIVGVVRMPSIPLVNGKTVPQFIHSGGSTQRWQTRPKRSRGRWEFWGGTKPPPRSDRYERRKILVRYRPRPFMVQALEKAVQGNQLVKQFARGGQ